VEAEADHTLKLRRALDHLQWLNDYEREWFRGDSHHSVRVTQTELDLRGMRGPYGFPLYQFEAWVRAEPPPTYPFAMVIGECLHNMRSALDLLAYELAVANVYPQPVSENVKEASEFPIIGDESAKGIPRMGAAIFRDNALPRKIRGVDPSAHAPIEAVQPYTDGAAFREHPLWRLHQLDRISKHRLLHTVVAFVEDAGFSLTRSKNFSGAAYPTPYPGIVQNERETKVASIAGGPMWDEEMVVVIKPTLSVCFAPDTPDADTAPVVPLLADVYAYITDNVLPWLEALL
jgi:hypothetical protein